MPADSFLTFSLLILAISFYLYPIEKYVKQKVPWHTYSTIISIILIPILVLFIPRKVPGDILCNVYFNECYCSFSCI
ncbi:MAG: hypothetical protein ACP6IY_15820 [Promethearchaeia archaeon]